MLRNGLDWLLARAAGVELPFVEFHDIEGDIGPYTRNALSRDDAIEALGALLALRREGLQQPLPFAPYSGWELFSAKTISAGIGNAAKKWRGNGNGGWAEGSAEALRLALRGRDPFDSAAALRDFARVTGIVFGAATCGLPASIDIDDVALPDDDAEDAA
ncbi:MAG TPA: exodeoxyribonuclease V subunit gamma, partial [Pseudoxanthomonas sp.]